jgi:hypothetical protein
MPRCKICRKKFEAKFFLQKACFDPACLAKWSEQDMKKKLNTTKKVKEIAYKIQKVKDTQRKKELMTRTQWFTKLKTVVHKLVVHVRDKDKGCYTCGKTDPSVKYDAGHRHHAGRGGGDRRRFILENIHKQCSVNCNQHGSGMPVEYDLALDAEYGEGFAEHLSCEANYPTLKELFPTWQDIELEIIHYRKLLKDAGV